jgi:uncharacterized membrane protein YjgN (DUF898 family)
VNVVPNISAAPRPVGATFSGTQRDMFRILMRGSLLQIPTFGFYRFWLVTDIRRHLWSNTRIGGDAFEYTGRGKELLIGFLIAMAVLVPIYILYFVASLEAERLQAFASVPLVGVLYVLGHYARYRARRYRATRTIFRGVRFWMSGSAWAYVGRAVLWDLLTIVTLGFAYPWRAAALERYKMRHTHYGNLDGSFVETGWTLFKRGAWLWAVFLVLAIATGVFAAMEDWTSMAVVAVALGLFAPFLLPIFQAMELRWWLAGVRLGPIAAESELGIGTIVWCYAKTALIAVAFLFCAGALAGVVAWSAVAGFPSWFDTGTLETPAMAPTLLGGISVALYYIAILLGLDIVRRLYLDRGVWAAAAGSVALTNLDALENVASTGAALSGSVGEGLLDALDMGGF